MACTDDLTGPDEETTLEVSASNTSGEGMADLSLRMDVDPYLYSTENALFVKVTTYLYNDGPANASEVQVALTSDIPCQVARADSTSEDNGPDGIIWDIDSASVAQSGVALETECLLNGLESIEISAEVMRSGQLDPDSTPGNGRPEEDDLVSLRLDPECGDTGCRVIEHVITHEIGH